MPDLGEGSAREAVVGKRERIDYREVLGDADFAAYAELRRLRKHLADRDGVPAYAVFTNEQLAEMVKRRIGSVQSLEAIEGVGEARLEKYAEPFLDALRRLQARAGRLSTERDDEAHAGQS